MKDPRIEKNIQSATVQNAAARIRLSKNDTWHVFYDTGLEFLTRFEQRIRRKRVWDAQFKAILISDPEFGQRSYTSVIDAIRNSNKFWFWWSMIFWSECRINDFENEADLRYNLQTNDSLIPNFTLKQIFYGKQKPGCNQGAIGIPTPKITKAAEGTSKTGKRVNSGV